MTSSIVSKLVKEANSELRTRSKERIEGIREDYIEGEIDVYEYEELLRAAMDDGPPYRKSWLVEQKQSRHHPANEFTDNYIIIYRGDHFKIDGNLARITEDDPQTERVVNVRGVRSHDEPKDEEWVEKEYDESEPSEEVKAKQAELKDTILGKEGWR